MKTTKVDESILNGVHLMSWPLFPSPHIRNALKCLKPIIINGKIVQIPLPPPTISSSPFPLFLSRVFADRMNFEKGRIRLRNVSWHFFFLALKKPCIIFLLELLAALKIITANAILERIRVQNQFSDINHWLI